MHTFNDHTGGTYTARRSMYKQHAIRRGYVIILHSTHALQRNNQDHSRLPRRLATAESR